jgi:hypothetical protein
MPGSWRAWILAACLACTALGQAAGQVGAGLRSILLTRPIWAPRQRLSRPRPQPLTWRLVTASSPSPPPRRGASMAWDADAGQLWLYGGELERARKNDTWMFSAADATWTPVLGPAPPPLSWSVSGLFEGGVAGSSLGRSFIVATGGGAVVRGRGGGQMTAGPPATSRASTAAAPGSYHEVVAAARVQAGRRRVVGWWPTRWCHPTQLPPPPPPPPRRHPQARPTAGR